jgi:hypothetical protein
LLPVLREGFEKEEKRAGAGNDKDAGLEQGVVGVKAELDCEFQHKRNKSCTARKLDGVPFLFSMARE